MISDSAAANYADGAEIAHFAGSFAGSALGSSYSRYSVHSDAGFFSSDYPAGCDSDADSERDERSDGEWFDAVIGYLEFRAGMGWRKRHSRRNAPRYNEYLAAIRLIQERRYLAEAPCNCAMCVADYGFRRSLTPALPPLYPGDKFFREHPELEPLANSSGQYVGYRPKRERWIDRPEVHMASCRCAKCRSAKKQILRAPVAAQASPAETGSSAHGDAIRREVATA